MAAQEDVGSLLSNFVRKEGEVFITTEFKSSLKALTDCNDLNDLNNARKWNSGKKLYATIISALYAFSVYVTFDFDFLSVLRSLGSSTPRCILRIPLLS